MNLKSIKAKPLNRNSRMRVGRGRGTGKGKTCGRGHKGQKARSGYKWHAYFEGGQMPLFRRLPKKGFNNGRFRKAYAIINVADLNRFPAGGTVDPSVIQEAGLVSNLRDGLKILGKGDVSVALTVKAHRFSEAAVKKIEAAGGTVDRIPPGSRAANRRKK
ncbi:MAG: 50S ribosomal protein L15 [Planctomycetota bacterium]|jgi:large subunit ribosomal protein L15